MSKRRNTSPASSDSRPLSQPTPGASGTAEPIHARTTDTPCADSASARSTSGPQHVPQEHPHRLREHLPQNRHYYVISFYVVVTFAIIYALIRIGNNIQPIMTSAAAAFHTASSILKPAIWGFILAFLLRPIVHRLQELLEKPSYVRKRGKSALGLSVAITFLLFVVLLGLVLTLVVSAFTHEITMLNEESLTAFINAVTSSLSSTYSTFQRWLNSLNISSKMLADAAQSLNSWLGSLASSAALSLRRGINNLPGILSSCMFAVIFAIYFLLDEKGLRSYWNKVLKAFTSRRFFNGVHTVLSDANVVFSGYIHGQLMDSLFMTVAISVILLLLDVKFAVIIGILSGIGNLIPYVCQFVAYGCTALACLLDQDFKKMIICIILLFILLTIDGNVINPRLLSRSISVHPVLVIVSLLIGSSLFGFVGMLLAVPTAGLLKLWFDRLIDDVSHKRFSQS
ncbi:MAG: AI-2E family transporter [Lachnospiraceae bacterium]|nr:AI-2E family transporter [Lachnospiraceae bacterium]